jgi:hypothetical protein
MKFKIILIVMALSSCASKINITSRFSYYHDVNKGVEENLDWAFTKHSLINDRDTFNVVKFGKKYQVSNSYQIRVNKQSIDIFYLGEPYASYFK